MTGPARTIGPTGVEAELELGDDPEVPSSASNAPEQVRVLLLAGCDELALGGDDVDLRVEQPLDYNLARFIESDPRDLAR
jgi:hypothetical protein